MDKLIVPLSTVGYKSGMVTDKCDQVVDFLHCLNLHLTKGKLIYMFGMIRSAHWKEVPLLYGATNV